MYYIFFIFISISILVALNAILDTNKNRKKRNLKND